MKRGGSNGRIKLLLTEMRKMEGGSGLVVGGVGGSEIQFGTC